MTLDLRARETFDGDPPSAYYLPLIQRQTDAQGLDYFEVPITFTETGDE